MNTNRLLADIAIVALLVLIGTLVYFAVPVSREGPTKDALTNDNQLSLSTTSTPTMPTNDLSKLKIEITREGAGVGAASGQTILVRYTGSFVDGKVFDSNVDGEPFPVVLGAGRVIQGWDIGLIGMKVGEVRTLSIPPELGYGAGGYPGVIPPNSTLIFNVELLGIQ